MRCLHTLTRLPLSVLTISLGLLSAAAPALATELAQLTPDDFDASVNKGDWFIEFFSPSCGHCRAFAPTWKKFVEQAAIDIPSVKTAQVNCLAYGDLCAAQHIASYPTLKYYHEGKFVEEFDDNRELTKLLPFVQKHADKYAPKANPNGEVLSLDSNTFALNLAKGPMFVKFFAPWCGHCKKLAPTWKQLASSLQNKLTIAEVNCDDNSALCKSHNIQGYPTLIYMTSEGLRSEYNGGRKLDQLKDFASKASAAGIQTISKAEIEEAVKENEVLYLLIHSASDHHIVEEVQRAAAPLLGSPNVYASSDSSLFTDFNIPETSSWALLAIKNHDLHAPASTLVERASTPEKLKNWLLTHRLPTALELTQDTFQTVMNAPQGPLVLIASYNELTKRRVEERIRELGEKWRIKTKGTGLAGSREVVLSWMDGERWKDWLKSMYGIEYDEDDENLDDVPVVIADHKNLVYYDKDPTDSRIKLSSSTRIFAAVESAASGHLSYKNSENFIERMARKLNQKLTSLEHFIVTYTWRFIFILVVIIVLVFMGLKRLLADDIPGDYRKTERLD